MIALVILAFLLAALPCVLYFRNSRVFHRLATVPLTSPANISVLIPARNEATGIVISVKSVLANEGVELEVIVLDDQSTDGTDNIVRELLKQDTRLSLATAPPLPEGWSGKQHACYVLSKLAKYDTFVFLDADVRLQPNALASLKQFQLDSNAELVSGFPKQETVGFLEQLIIPLINWLLLSYLPFDRMRTDKSPSLGAGCGQWFLTTRTAYETTGGHSHPLVKNSFHDGIKLPRAYRQHGFRTDVADATDVATCRMYRTAGQVWNGFAKNAREGIGSPKGIWLWTFLLWAGHILPWMMVVVNFFIAANIDINTMTSGGTGLPTPASALPAKFQLAISLVTVVLSLLPRIHAAVRFRQSWLGVLLHPLSILGLLVIQWYANIRAWVGKPVGWKGRTLQSTESST